MASNHANGLKPLAAALALALGAAIVPIHADAQSAPDFAARMKALRAAAAQAYLDYSRHPLHLPRLEQRAPVKFAHRKGNWTSSPAATISVTICSDAAGSATTPGSLRHAVLNAAAGDSIDLSACSNSVITLTQGALAVPVDDLTIGTAGGGKVTIDGNGTDRVFNVQAPGVGVSNVFALHNLVVRNGKAPVTANGSTPTANGGCIVSGLDAVALYASTVTGCQAVVTGGNAYGGGIFSPSGAYLYDSTVSANRASSDGAPTSGKYAALGGGIATGALYLRNSHIENNSAIASNGANFADGGGALGSFAVDIKASTISNNTVRIDGGADTNAKYMGVGGGISSKYSVALESSTISGNNATCTVSGGATNVLCIGGGVILGKGQSSSAKHFDVSYSTVSGNHSDLIGGGLVSKYGMNLAQSTISGNSAAGGGGLTLKYSSGAKATIYNATIAGNSASEQAAGIYEFPLPSSGGGSPAPVPLALTSTIVAGNLTAGSADDIYLDQAYSMTVTGSTSLVVATTPNITLQSDTLHDDPLLAPLADNGGPTRTRGLLQGSPAINAGANPLAFANDQRGAGFPRSSDGLVSIGAFQGIAAAAAAPVPTPALSGWALGLLAGLLALLGWRGRRTIP